MAATATILSPRTDDTVGLNVPISVAYAGFTGETLNTDIDGHADPSPPTPTDDAGLHQFTVTTTALPALQTVTTKADTTSLDSQPNVKVSSGDTPTPIDEPVIEEIAVKGPKKLKKASGTVPVGSTAAYVVCQVIRVDAASGATTVVGAGAGTVKANRKWEVDFDPSITLDPAPNIQYAIQARVYDKAMAFLGSETKPVIKK